MLDFFLYERISRLQGEKGSKKGNEEEKKSEAQSVFGTHSPSLSDSDEAASLAAVKQIEGSLNQKIKVEVDPGVDSTLFKKPS